jgi:nitroreductase
MDRAERWPVRFWDVDAAMASMLMLLAAVDEGLGGWFFGITHGERALLDRFGVPDRLRPIGILGLGYRAADEVPTGSGTTRPRRSLDEQVHRNRW